MTIGTDTLIATQAFTGSDGTALPAPFATRRGNWAIYSNACGHQLGLALGTNSCTANPARGNDDYSVTATANQDESAGTVKGIMLRRSNGSTTTNNAYLLGRDDSGHACIWKLANDVETALFTSSGAITLDGTYKASVETVTGSAVLTLTNGAGTTIATYTDSSSPLLSGDIGFFDNMNGATGLWDNVSMVGTSAGSTGSGATTETGSDTASGVGSVPSTGTGASVEGGPDTVSAPGSVATPTTVDVTVITNKAALSGTELFAMSDAGVAKSATGGAILSLFYAGSGTVTALAGVSKATFRIAFATNGRKSGEGAAAGTGCPVWSDGTNWRTFYDNSIVAA